MLTSTMYMCIVFAYLSLQLSTLDLIRGIINALYTTLQGEPKILGILLWDLYTAEAQLGGGEGAVAPP